jgi:hypothetical protein
VEYLFSSLQVFKDVVAHNRQLKETRHSDFIKYTEPVQPEPTKKARKLHRVLPAEASEPVEPEPTKKARKLQIFKTCFSGHKGW